MSRALKSSQIISEKMSVTYLEDFAHCLMATEPVKHNHTEADCAMAS